jgi:hypothetical protein
MFTTWLGKENEEGVKKRTARTIANILLISYQAKCGVKVTVSGKTVYEIPPNPL